VLAGGSSATNVNHWQPLYITNAAAQNGISLSTTQRFLGSQWLSVRPFALSRNEPSLAWLDPGPPPYLGDLGDTAFRTELVDLITRSSELTPDDPTVLDISPAVLGNNSLGANDGAGYSANPVAEFWADGPNSETPPGHWNVIANQVADNPLFTKRIAGAGPVLADLEWDVKIYFALNAAVHDAACAAWSLKRIYDGWRPIEANSLHGPTGAIE
jgi:hypothetical protein